ncbi:MAG: HDOD domain-containing protein [Candidatus Lindowbacteria bacterium]|nr:HDOD domain-containing protein [Candidatus Lindowbacteria bacterium]
MSTVDHTNKSAEAAPVSAEEFRKKLLEIKEISTLPHVMVRIMEIITDENSSASDLAKEIAKDASLTAKILKIVNSAYYGFYREIIRVSDAVVVLGFNEIRRLSLAISVLDMFGGKQREQRFRFWTHSFACAAMCDILSKEWRMHDKGAFTAGLLHDIGKAALDQHFSDMFSAAQACMEERSLRAHEAEKMLFGFDHSDIGYWLCERWNLPVSLSEAIRCHHRPETAQEAPQLAMLVHTADELVTEFLSPKAAETPAAEAPQKQETEFPVERKADLLLELRRRLKDSKGLNIFS